MGEPPKVGRDGMGSNAGAEPIVAYHGSSSVSIRLTSANTGSLKEAFIEFRSQKKAVWRVAVHSDGELLDHDSSRCLCMKGIGLKRSYSLLDFQRDPPSGKS